MRTAQKLIGGAAVGCAVVFTSLADALPKLSVSRTNAAVNLSWSGTRIAADGSTVRPYFEIGTRPAPKIIQPKTLNEPTYFVYQDRLGNDLLLHVYRSKTNQPVTLHYNTTTNGTAIPDRDFVSAEGDIFFQPGEFYAWFTLTPIDTRMVQPAKTIGLSLRETNGAAVDLSFPVIRNRAVPTTVDLSFRPGIPLTGRALGLPNGGFIEVLEGVFEYGQCDFNPGPPASEFLFALNEDGHVTSSLGRLEFPDLQSVAQPISIHLLFSGGVLVLGGFSQFNTNAVSGAVRLAPDLSLENSFALPELRQAGKGLSLLTEQADGGLVISVGADRLVRCLSDGRLDAAFQAVSLARFFPDDTSMDLAAVEDGQGKLLLTGAFTNVSSVDQSWLARLNRDGTVDTTFRPRLGARDGFVGVRVLPMTGSGKIFVAGYFAEVNGVAQPGLARLNSDGSLDATFKSTIAVNWMTALDPVSGGKFLVSGALSDLVKGKNFQILRFNSDGSADPTFQADASAATILAALSDGTFLAGSSVGPEQVVVLEANGARNPDFLALVAAQPDQVIEQRDGSVVLLGTDLGSPVRLVKRNVPQTLFSLVSGSDPYDTAIEDDGLFFGGLGTQDGNLLFKVRRAGDVRQSGSVSFETADGTFVSGNDYAVAVGTVEFAPGEIDKVIRIGLLNHADQRFGTLRLRLQNPLGGNIVGSWVTWVNLPAPASTPGTTADAPAAPMFWFNPQSIAALNDGFFVKSYSTGIAMGSVESSTELQHWTSGELVSLPGLVIASTPGQLLKSYHLQPQTAGSSHGYLRARSVP